MTKMKFELEAEVVEKLQAAGRGDENILQLSDCEVLLKLSHQHSEQNADVLNGARYCPASLLKAASPFKENPRRYEQAIETLTHHKIIVGECEVATTGRPKIVIVLEGDDRSLPSVIIRWGDFLAACCQNADTKLLFEYRSRIVNQKWTAKRAFSHYWSGSIHTFFQGQLLPREFIAGCLNLCRTREAIDAWVDEYANPYEGAMLITCPCPCNTSFYHNSGRPLQ